MSIKELNQIEKKIKRIKDKLMSMGEMRPGSLSKQYSRCGTLTCRCHDKNNPKKHGPYYQLSYVHRGKSSSQFIAKHSLLDTKMQINNYKVFKKLIDKWIDLATSHAKLKMQMKRNEKLS